MPTHILLIEDDPDINFLIETTLTSKGFHVVPLFQGNEVISTIRRQPIDLILLDLFLPSMSGRDILVQLKADPHFSQIPVVIISARQDKRELEEMLRLGALDYIEKPFIPSELAIRIRNIIAQISPTS
jgi:DNA-binding response OmpR family regulator